MGAKVEVAGNAVLVHGPSALHGTEVIAHDLRTGIALVLAGLAAEGETIVSPGYLIDRGHACDRRPAGHPGRRHHRGNRRLTRRCRNCRSLTIVGGRQSVLRGQRTACGDSAPFTFSAPDVELEFRFALESRIIGSSEDSSSVSCYEMK